MNDLIQYLKDTLGVDPKLKTLNADKVKTLPVFMRNLYDYKLIHLYRKDIILVFAQNNYTTGSLKKHLDIIRNKLDTITVAVLSNVEAYQRLRLVEKKIPFIIPGKQMYLPDLLIDFRDYGTKPMETPLVMRPSAQMLLLYHLQVGDLDDLNFKEIARKLGYSSAMTITKAAYYLHNIELCTITGTKEKSLHFNFNKKELWEEAEPYMQSPVKNTVYFSGHIHGIETYRTNINALAHYTDLNNEPIDYYAVRPGKLKHLADANLKETRMLEGNICIEEWKYSPYYLTNTENVDPLSLYLCFRNNPDERVEIALEQLIEKVKW